MMSNFILTRSAVWEL